MVTIGDFDSLALPPGVDPVELTRAVGLSGYPLQTVVARQLLPQFRLTEEWGYVDRESREHRALDLFGYARLEPESFGMAPAVNVLIECKRSELPYIFIEASIPRLPNGFPSVVGLKNKRLSVHARNRSRDVSIAEILGCSDLPFGKNPPAVASTFCRAERKGKSFELSGTVPYNNVVLPLASALDHHRSMWDGTGDQETYWPQLAFCICVADAPLLVASGTPEAPQLRNEPWIRIIRQEATKAGQFWSTKHYVIDVVSREFLGDFVNSHLLPFANEVAGRMIEKEAVLRAGGGSVPDLDHWTWREVRAQAR